MKYLAHISDDKKREQSLMDHNQETAILAGTFAKCFHHEEWGYCAGLLHDIGKYSLKFQERLRGKNISVDHATAGAQVCVERGGGYQFISYCIAGHHAGLPDTGSESDTGDQATWFGRRKKTIEDYQDYKKEINVPTLSRMKIIPDRQMLRPDYTISFFIRMLYSCLVDADFLDTEAFMNGGSTGRDAGESIDILLKKLEKHISPWMKNKEPDTVNGHRTEILRNCLEAGVKRKGLYRLTVPTGGGKTISSLAFALKHAAEHQMDRVIYVIPYTSIIEQNAHIFGEILGWKNVLEDHCNVDYESCEELRPMHLAAENWDKPVVVTTNVQFFESLFANKSSKCRKLHNIANSVVIFDEAQMLPAGYLKPCIAAMEELLRNYECTLVLCTATQPSLDGLFTDGTEITELCPRMEQQFDFFKRVTVQKIGKIEEERLVSLLEKENQALCILNTKKNAQKVYQLMSGDGVYHLSTSMYPTHRKCILKTVKERLKAGKKCVLVATSLVEAGVDLDFQTVYRQQAGIDSMIQAAGRCNREGKRKAEESMVYIFSMDGSKVPGQELQIQTARQIMERYEDISSLEAIHDYFRYLYHHTGEGLDKKRILEQFKKKRFSFCTVGKIFRLIEEDTVSVFVAKEEAAQELLEEINSKGFSKKRMREAGKYIVNLYENDFNKLYGAGMLEKLGESDGLWILKNEEAYTEETGLALEIEEGCAVIM